MKVETLKIYSELLRALEAERDEIETKISGVRATLAGDSIPSDPKRGRPGRTPAEPAPVHGSMVAGGGRRGRRPKGEMSLRDAIITVTQSKPLTKEEILGAVQAVGYEFATANPINSIKQVLYGKKPKFKNDGGKFSVDLRARRAAAREGSTAAILPLAVASGGSYNGNGMEADQPGAASEGKKARARRRKRGRPKKNA